MSTQIRGFAPATRVMSRSEPPAAASGSWPSIRPAPAWLTSRFASACGRWLVSATSRSCARGSIATGDGAERGDEAVHEPVALRVGAGGRRQEPGRAVEEVGGRVRRARAPRGRRPGWPPTKRSGKRTDQSFVEPTSVTVQRSGARASTSCDEQRQHGHRRGDDGEVGVGEHLGERCRPRRAPRARGAIGRRAARRRRSRRPSRRRPASPRGRPRRPSGPVPTTGELVIRSAHRSACP